MHNMQAPDTSTDDTDTSTIYPPVPNHTDTPTYYTPALIPTSTYQTLSPDVGCPSTALTSEVAMISTATSSITAAADVDKKTEYNLWTVAERLGLILGIIGSVIAVGTLAQWVEAWMRSSLAPDVGPVLRSRSINQTDSSCLG